MSIQWHYARLIAGAGKIIYGSFFIRRLAAPPKNVKTLITRACHIVYGIKTCLLALYMFFGCPGVGLYISVNVRYEETVCFRVYISLAIGSP